MRRPGPLDQERETLTLSPVLQNSQQEDSELEASMAEIVKF